MSELQVHRCSNWACWECGSCSVCGDRHRLDCRAASRSERGAGPCEHGNQYLNVACPDCPEDSGNGPQAQSVHCPDCGAPAGHAPEGRCNGCDFKRQLATAAQSPQEGAARGALRALFGAVEDGTLVRNTARDAEPGFAIKALTLVVVLGRARDALAAEPGRSASDRPRNPESSPVASADPELAVRALRVARAHCLGKGSDPLWVPWEEALRIIDSALSRLAGQEGSNGK